MGYLTHLWDVYSTFIVVGSIVISTVAIASVSLPKRDKDEG